MAGDFEFNPGPGTAYSMWKLPVVGHTPLFAVELANGLVPAIPTDSLRILVNQFYLSGSIIVSIYTGKCGSC